MPLGTRTKRFVPENVAYLPSHGLLLQSQLGWFSLHNNAKTPWLLPATLIYYYQQSFFGSTAIQLSMFETLTLAAYLLGFHTQVPSSLKHLQGWRFHSILGQPVLVFNDPHILGPTSLYPLIRYTSSPSLSSYVLSRPLMILAGLLWTPFLCWSCPVLTQLSK